MVSISTLAVGLVALFQCTVRGVDAASMPASLWPKSTGTITSAQAITVPAGMTYDGKMHTFERSDVTCKGQVRSGVATAMFILEAGATLKNVIIGKNQMEGVQCEHHDCTIENVWWTDVCENALTVKGGTRTSITRVVGGGAQYADDKIVQHNGAGTVSIDGFYAMDFGRLYRSCENCGAIQRNVIVSNLFAVNPSGSIVTVNSNYADTATLRSIRVQSSKKDVEICVKTISVGSGEPAKSGSGPDGTVCKYAAVDVVITSPATQSTASLSAPATPAASSLPAPATPLSTPIAAPPALSLSPAMTSRSPLPAQPPVPTQQSRSAPDVDGELPGRVRSLPSSEQLPSGGAAATPLDPQSLSFNSPAPEPAQNSFSFRRLRS